MDLETAFVTVWNGNVNVLSNGLANRLYPGHAPEETLPPYAIYEQTGGAPVMTMAGPVGLADYRMSLTIVGISRAQVLAARNAILASAANGGLNGFVGNVGYGLLKLQGMFNEDSSTHYNAPVHADDVGTHECECDFRIWYHQ